MIRGSPSRPRIQIGPWQTLASTGGGAVALDGDLTALADSARLVVWRGVEPWRSAEAPWPAPSVPRFCGERVFWGPGVLNLTDGRYTSLEAARPTTWPGGGERPHLHAWSPDGERLVVSYSTDNDLKPTRVSLFDRNRGERIAIVWEGMDLPPQAAWAGRQVVVVGFADPRVFDIGSGVERGCVALGGGTVARLDADEAESRLVAVDLNRSIAWIDPRTLLVLDRWNGEWLDAAIAPDGEFLAALDFRGRLHIAALAEGRFLPLGEVVGMPSAAAIALGRDAVVVAGGGLLARATFALSHERNRPPE